MMKLAIANNSLKETDALVRFINTLKDTNVVWTTTDGAEVVNYCKTNKPDLILLGMELDNLDGREVTKRIMNEVPTAVLLLTNSLTINQSKVFEAFGYGALDVVSINLLGDSIDAGSQEELTKKIGMFTKLTKYALEFSDSKIEFEEEDKLVVIGSSTGGPKVLSIILSRLPAKIFGSIVIIQHVDTQFTFGLIDWLKTFSKNPVMIAKSGEVPKSGNIYIAGGDEHLLITSTGQFKYSVEPISYHYRPSVNVFFESVALNYNNNGLAVLLTGMGSDGAKGLLSLKKKGWYTIAQDERTSVVYGMPKAAFELGAASKVLNIEEISDEINKFLR